MKTIKVHVECHNTHTHISHYSDHFYILSTSAKSPTIKNVSLSVTLVLMETNADLEKCETRKNLRQIIWTYVPTFQNQLCSNRKKLSVEKPSFLNITNQPRDRFQRSSPEIQKNLIELITWFEIIFGSTL